jgi:hypothetical protein
VLLRCDCSDVMHLELRMPYTLRQTVLMMSKAIRYKPGKRTGDGGYQCSFTIGECHMGIVIADSPSIHPR